MYGFSCAVAPSVSVTEAATVGRRSIGNAVTQNVTAKTVINDNDRRDGNRRWRTVPPMIAAPATTSSGPGTLFDPAARYASSATTHRSRKRPPSSNHRSERNRPASATKPTSVLVLRSSPEYMIELPKLSLLVINEKTSSG